VCDGDKDMAVNNVYLDKVGSLQAPYIRLAPLDR
jgi:hypothetical protein